VKRQESELCGKQEAAGFTLVEIVITIVLISIIAALAAMVILQGVQGYSAEDQRSNIHYEARLAMERMTREIRLIRNQGTDIATMTSTNLQYTDVNGASVGFNWTSPNLSRWNGVGYDLLASGITSFTFSYLQQDGVSPATTANVWFVDIVITSSQPGSDSLVMHSRVHPMNF